MVAPEVLVRKHMFASHGFMSDHVRLSSERLAPAFVARTARSLYKKTSNQRFPKKVDYAR